MMQNPVSCSEEFEFCPENNGEPLRNLKRGGNWSDCRGYDNTGQGGPKQSEHLEMRGQGAWCEVTLCCQQGSLCGVKMETDFTAAPDLFTSQKIARPKSIPSSTAWRDWGVLFCFIMAVCMASKNKGEEQGLFKKKISNLPLKLFFSAQLNV